MPNIAVLAPIPSASATITDTANPGDCLSPRKACLRSWLKSSKRCENERIVGTPTKNAGGYGVPF
jgi:hypothetical protein